MAPSIHTLCLVIVILTVHCIALRLYPFSLNPKENPDYDRYAVKHPTQEDLGHTPQFATLRTLRVMDKIVNYSTVINQYCLNPNTTLGNIVWPRDPGFMFADNYKEFVDYIKLKGLSITSVHGFSPVNAGFRPPEEVLKYLEEVLSMRWFGMANGEQDGHYFGGFLIETLPQNMKPLDQYLLFREYFRAMEDILGPKMTTLLSSTFPHYQLKSGLYTVAGAETSQHGPNAQLRYSFIRGAGKQYGVLWFGNVSVYNRFGHKVYTKNNNEVAQTGSKRKRRGNDKGVSKYEDERIEYMCGNNDTLKDLFGPRCGTSLNLMKRLLYAQMMYNSAYVSFEDGWFTENNNSSTLSPIGLIQHNAYLWSMKMPSLGTHVPTIALYLDFFSGWTAPRLKDGAVYRMWSHLPYSPADYFTDGVLRMVYPSYQDASYFHDESGISSSTPYGDSLDVVLSDAPVWLLRQYNTILIGGKLSSNLAEVADNLEQYVMEGGNVVLSIGVLEKFQNGLLNVTADERSCKVVPAGSKFQLIGDKTVYTEIYSMSLCDVYIGSSMESLVVAELDSSIPLSIVVTLDGGGTLTILASKFGVSLEQVASPTNAIDTTLISPYPLLESVQKVINSTLTMATLFSSSANLSIVANFLGNGEYMVLVSNPLLVEQPFKLLSPNAKISSMSEVMIDQSEKGMVGYLPDGFENANIGQSTNTTIAGGDTRLFKVTIDQNTVIKLIPKSPPKLRPRGITLHMRHIRDSIRHSILLRPTFIQHFDSVVVDYSYITAKDVNFLKNEKMWLEQQSVMVYVDASSAINLFPGIRLTNDSADLYNDSILTLSSLIEKTSALGSHDLVISLHILPSAQSKEASEKDFNATLHFLMKKAASLDITLHMLDTPKNPFQLMPLSRWLESNGLLSMKFVLNLASLVEYGSNFKTDSIISSRSSLLYVSAPGRDDFGMNYTVNTPISKTSESNRKDVATMVTHVCSLRLCPYRGGTQEKPSQAASSNGEEFYPFIMDAAYEDLNEEYNDVHWIEQLLLEEEE